MTKRKQGIFIRRLCLGAWAASFALIGSVPVSFAQEPVIVQDIRNRVKQYGYSIKVEIVHNKKTDREDLLISPAESGYSSGAFIFAVAHGVSDATSISITYQLFFGMVLVEINDELWAISASNCRKIFSLRTAEEQNELFRKSLKRLR